MCVVLLCVGMLISCLFRCVAVLMLLRVVVVVLLCVVVVALSVVCFCVVLVSRYGGVLLLCFVSC